MNSRPRVRPFRDDPAPPVEQLFAVQLWEHRTAHGWSQEELAERAGLSVRGIRALEQGGSSAGESPAYWQSSQPSSRC